MQRRKTTTLSKVGNKKSIVNDTKKTQRRGKRPSKFSKTIKYVVYTFMLMIISILMYQFVTFKREGKTDAVKTAMKAVSNLRKKITREKYSIRLAHLDPAVPYLPIFAQIPNDEELIKDTLSGLKPTITGIVALLQKFLSELHKSNIELSAAKADVKKVISTFYKLASKHLVPFDEAYRGKSIFPIREDGSIYLSLAAYREHLLADTLIYAFDNAKHPDKIFVGVVVQNCFGLILPDGTIDASGKPCRTGVEVVGKNKMGRDMTKVSDAPIDKNGIYEFCTNQKYKKYCDAGQIRALYVHETESLGPAMARYYASKLWGGETYFVQTDSHLKFADEWDEKYRDEIKATSNFPKSILSSYPPGYNIVKESPGTRLCTCETRFDDPNPMIRITTGSSYHGGEPRPTQIPFVAAGFFFTRSEFLIDIPFDPFIPWCFMGEEIALSLRSWTHGWNIYAPRKNLIKHQYRPGRMGLPKYWESVNRLHGRSINSSLQAPLIKRIKHLAGYPSENTEKLKQEGNEYLLEGMEHYGVGQVRTLNEYMKFAGISVDKTNDSLKCHKISWCVNGELE